MPARAERPCAARSGAVTRYRDDWARRAAAGCKVDVLGI
jgi:hypothetical protein